MAPHLTINMMAFIGTYPGLRTEAINRDAIARDFFKEDYGMYAQGCVKVIQLRTNATAAGRAATSSPPIIPHPRKLLCSICGIDVHDFTRHNREKHIKDPGQTFYCPYPGCNMTTCRDGQITIDDHLASAHNDFRNSAGRGGDLLDRSNKPHVLSKLSTTAARFVAQHRQDKVPEYKQRRARLIDELKTAGINYPKLKAATLPVEVENGQAGLPNFKKAQAIAHAILVGKALNTWEDLFEVARQKLP